MPEDEEELWSHIAAMRKETRGDGLRAEVERLQYWIDQAFAAAAAGDAHAARVALTSARWGEAEPVKALSDGRKTD